MREGIEGWGERASASSSPPNPTPGPSRTREGRALGDVALVSHSGLITVMQKAARKAAPRLRRAFGEVEQLQVSRKGPADFVSMADKLAEEPVMEELRHARPDRGFLMEEAGEV